MAKHRLTRVDSEVADVRSRLLVKNWDTVTVDVYHRFAALRRFMREVSGDEVCRHVVVSTVGALQTFQRGTIVSLVNFSEMYRIRAAEFFQEKVSLKDAMRWLSGESFTFGELAAHMASCNSAADMITVIEVLLECKLRSALESVVDPLKRRNGVTELERIVPDFDRLIVDLDEAFRWRHIFAHEAAVSVELPADRCKALLNAVVQWTQAIDGLLWATAYRDLPLTQYEMNVHAGKEVAEARARLAKAMRKASRVMEKRSLRKNHFTWRTQTNEWSDIAYGGRDGTMWPAVRGTHLAKAYDFRAEEVLACISSLDEPGTDADE